MAVRATKCRWTSHRYVEVWPGIFCRCPCGKSLWWWNCSGVWRAYMPPENLARHGYGAHMRHIHASHRQVWDEARRKYVPESAEATRRRLAISSQMEERWGGYSRNS